MRRRLGIIWTVVLITTRAMAQNSDSLMLETVNVFALSKTQYLTGSKTINLDSVFLQTQSANLLSENLMLHLPAYMRNRGVGMISSISLRGTSPQHTNVLWEGININSFSLGQADFSTLPMAAIGQAEVHLGGGSTQFGSGAIGGSILLNSSKNTSSGLGGYLQLGRGSFGRSSHQMGLTYGSESQDVKVSLYDLSADNNFPVKPSNRRQPHAAWKQQGATVAASYYLHSKAKLDANIWLHADLRQAQPPMGSSRGSDTLQNQNLRTSLAYTHAHALGESKIQTAFIEDNILFNGRDGRVQRFVQLASHQWKKHNHLLKIETEWNHIIGLLEGYGEQAAIEERVDFSAAYKTNFSNGLSISVNSRKPWVSGFETPWLFYAGMEWSLAVKKWTMTPSFNLSNNFRVPTLNDRFWLDVGKPDLKPEQSVNVETGISFQHVSLFNPRIQFNAYRYLVDNWIQWTPNESNQWRPENVQQVLSQGLEAEAGFTYRSSKWRFSPSIRHAYTSSTVMKAIDERFLIGKQLIYTPLHTSTFILNAQWNGFFITTDYQLIGERYTTADNSAVFSLPSIGLWNMHLGKNLVYKQHKGSVMLTANNVLDTNYQLFINHAMPGINFNFQLNYHIN